MAETIKYSIAKENVVQANIPVDETYEDNLNDVELLAVCRKL
jgi:hypothetical protein